MSIFRLYDCDIGIKVDGVSYDFPHVDEIQIEDTERNRLTRGANAQNKEGLSYKDGLKDPKKWTTSMMDMSKELKAVFDNAFDKVTRLDVYCIARSDGSSKWLRSAVMSNRPQQLQLDDTAESLKVSLEFEGFDSSEVHKS